jgi:esterase FrsA
VNDVDELKQYIGVHAEGLEIDGYRQILDRITTDGEGPGSWVGEWSGRGDQLTGEGRHLEAGRHHLIARFPFVDGPARKAAYLKSLEGFARWSEDAGVHRFDVMAGGRVVGCWGAGLGRGRPLLVIMGGHLTLKEQWAPALPVFERLGFAAVATEMPGVGENAVRYDAEAHRFLPAVIDALADQADVTRTYLLAMSFSGNLALRAALDDRRIRGVVTAGAPISGLFVDPAWQSGLPRVTVDTLTHLTGAGITELSFLAWRPQDLARVAVPVAYLHSLRDEVIPPDDVALLRAHVRDLRLLQHDDVHGSPAHTEENKLWLALQLLRMRNPRDPRVVFVAALWALARLRTRLITASTSRRLRKPVGAGPADSRLEPAAGPEVLHEKGTI